MPQKRKRNSKDSASKQTLNPRDQGNRRPETETREPTERDMERKIGQFTGEGTPPLQKR